MYPTYELKVMYKGIFIFEGAFLSMNKAIKTACFFDDDCVFSLLNIINNKELLDYEVKMLRKEFRYGEIFI